MKLTSLVNLFYPLVCAGCETFLLHSEAVICTSCRHEIPLTQHLLQPENEAWQKFYGRIPVERVAALTYFHKKGIMQEVIHKLKYRGHEEVGTVIGHWFAAEIKDKLPEIPFTCIVPVPLHPKKLRERGYNQVAVFGKTLSEHLNIPYIDSVLIRARYSNTQTKKDLLARSEIGNSVFDVTDLQSLSGHHILLVDDVITTGSTLEVCCRALLKIPNIKISIACMAMSHS